jgi:dTDP-4-amino-4,6-dideoxygalactose transaminase
MISLNENLKSFRNQIISQCASKGVSTNVHFKPLSLMTAFQNEEARGSLAHSIDLFEREVSLPIYPQLSNEQVDYITKTIMDAINKVAH